MVRFKSIPTKNVPEVTTMVAMMRSLGDIIPAIIILLSGFLAFTTSFEAFGQDAVVISVLNAPTSVTTGTTINFDWTISGVTDFNGGHTNLHCFADKYQHSEDQWIYSSQFGSEKITSLESEYSGKIEVTQTEQYQCRVHVGIGNQNILSDQIYVIEVISPTLTIESFDTTAISGENFSFSGRLFDPITGDGIVGATVFLCDDYIFENYICQGTASKTNKSGEFSIDKEIPPPGDGHQTINYYVYINDSQNSERIASSKIVSIDVWSTAVVTLDEPEKKILAQNDMITFRGKLTTPAPEKTPLPDKKIIVKEAGFPDKPLLNSDKSEVKTSTDANGNFIITWRPPPTDDKAYALFASLESSDQKVLARSLYMQLAVLKPDLNYNEAGFVTCNLTTDTPFQYTDSTGKEVTEKGVLASIGMILKSHSESVYAGQSGNLNFMAKQGNLLFNIRGVDETVSSLALSIGTPLIQGSVPSEMISISGWSLKGTTAFKFDISSFGAASFDSKDLIFTDWGVQGTRLSVFETANNNDEISVVVKSNYVLKGELKNKEDAGLSMTLISRSCSPDMRINFNVENLDDSQSVSPEVTNIANPENPILSVDTDKPSYDNLNQITVTVALGIPEQEVTLIVTDPSGNEVLRGSIITDSHGNGETVFGMQGDYLKKGTYRATVTSNVKGEFLSSSTDFIFKDNTSHEAPIKFISRSVNIEGKDVQVNVQTSSTMSPLFIEKEHKRISFSVSGDDGTEGTTIIPIGQILEGPYLVSIDEVPTDNFEVINDDNEASIKVWYTHSMRTITISGTNVVPEFSPFLIGMLLASMIAAIIVFSRVPFLKSGDHING